MTEPTPDAEIHTTFCRICEALCGLEVTVEDGRVVDVEPDKQHPVTKGFACIKGLSQHKIYDSPDRLTVPEKRVGDRWERISWEQALAEIGQKVRQLRMDHHADAIAMYVGTAAGFGVLHPVFAQGFMMGLGSSSMYSSATQDCSNKFAVATQIYGFPFTQPFPDIEHTECLIIVGANPVVSKWSFLQVPNPVRHLKALTRRGARLFVVDPRRTETAKVAGEHVFIRPGTDVFFYLAFLNALIVAGGVDFNRIERYVKGFEAVRELVAPWTPERCAEVTCVAPEVLREMVDAYRNADGAALYSSTGVNMGGNGALAFWLQEVINAVSGNLDRRGGTLVGRGVIDFEAFGKKHGILLRTDRSRVGDYASVNDGYPGGVLADEILTPGDKQVRALFVTGGNPLITMANAGRLKKAFEELELLVTLDIFKSETASLAHYVLPCTSPLQRPDLPFVFPLMLGMQLQPYLQATRRVIPPAGEQRDEATIYLELCRAAGVSIFGSRTAQWTLSAMKRVHSLRRRPRLAELPQEWLLSTLLRITRQGSFSRLLKSRHGRMRGPHKPGDFLARRVVTDDGLLDLAPKALLEAARSLEETFAREHADAHRFKLITKRAVTTQNSWTHNHSPFVSGQKRTNYLYMHPDDAAAAGLSDGELVDVSSDTGSVRVPLKLLTELMPRTVALPHGWGHQGASGLSVASRTTGVNVNILAADGPDRLERVSGMAHLTGIVVDVSPAAGPLEPRSWSGVREKDEV